MVKTIDEIATVIELRKTHYPPADIKFLKLLRIDSRLLKDKELFKELGQSFFGPSFGKYLAGYAFDPA